MKKVITILLILLLVAAVAFRLIRFFEEKSNEAEGERLQQVYEEVVTGKSPASSTVDEKLIGRITIPTLDINYVILNKTTDQNLDISITKVVGPDIHQKGNLVLAGHNLNNGGFFGRLKNIKGSDKILLETPSGQTETYVLREKYLVKETDLSPLDQSEQTKTMLTLITCTDDVNERLIVVAEKQ